MFPMLSFDQANPVTGLQRMQNQDLMNQYAQLMNNRMTMQNRVMPQTLQEQLARLQLGNQKSEAELPYAGPQAAANVGLTTAQTGETTARIPLYKAQADLATQQANYFPYTTAAGFDDITKMRVGQMFAKMLGLAGPGGQVAATNVPALQTNNNGMTVSPGGANNVPSYLLRPGMQQPGAQAAAMPVLPGGLSAGQGQNLAQQLNTLAPQPGAQQQAQAQPQSSPFGMQPIETGDAALDSLYAIKMKNILSGLTKDPTKGSNRAGAGGTYTDPYTGAQFSTDTDKSATLDQQAVGAIQRVQPILKSLSDNLAPFQTGTGQLALKLSQAGNYLGGNNKLGNQYAQGQADLKMAPEGLLKAWGLNVTNESLQTMREAVEPVYGESKKGYEQRIINTLKRLQENEAGAQGRLKGGINLDGQNAALNSQTPAIQNNAAQPSMVRVQSPNGTVFNVPVNQVGALLKDHPDHKRIG